MRKVEVFTKIRTTPEQVIKAFTDYEMLRDWWGVARVLIDNRPGGLYTLTWNVSEKGFGYVSTGIIKSYQPDKELVIDNLVYLNPEKPLLGPMSLTIRASAEADMASVFLCQEGYQSGKVWDWYYEVVKQVWPEVMKELKKYLEN